MAGNFKINSSRIDDIGNRMMDFMLSHKTSVDLLQNCDLPPPLKVFSGIDETKVSSKNKILGCMDQQDGSEDFGKADGLGKSEKMELLRALQLSQTRAREAERQAACLAEERDCLANSFLEESMRTFAYRQWVRLFEVQVCKLKKQAQIEEQTQCCWRPHRVKGLSSEDGDGDAHGVGQMILWAICLGIAGIGVALGYKYLI